METRQIRIPRYYQPWPHQVRAWQRRDSGAYDYYIKLWSRQTGKDADDIEYAMNRSWRYPGTQSVYVGLDNVWIRNNIFNKYIDGRRFWADYPEDQIEVKDTAKEVLFKNNPGELAEARIKFLGFLNDSAAIGSSYDNFYVSEASLYSENAFQYIQPIWDQKAALGRELFVCFNGTPRGMHNVFYELLRTYTGEDEPEAFPGPHGRVYVDYMPIQDVIVPDGHGGYRPMYTAAELERLKDRYLRQFGNLNLYEQEYECKFTTVNAGLVYQGVRQLREEKRYCPYNLDTHQPVYVAWDIGSKDKMTDSTAAVVYQYYNGHMYVYDVYEARGQALVDCVAELAARDWWQYVRVCMLPWDSERSASSETPLEEAQRIYPNVTWHALEKERVDRGINEVRRMLPNLIVNSDRCDWLMQCFDNYEYKRLVAADDWAAKPVHNRYSHLMDALRYAVMGVNEMAYLRLNAYGEDPAVAGYYPGWDDPDTPQPRLPLTLRKPRRSEGGVYYYG